MPILSKENCKGTIASHDIIMKYDMDLFDFLAGSSGPTSHAIFYAFPQDGNSGLTIPKINGHFRNLNWRYLPYM